ncbi:MAG: hypothetical protein JWO86_2609 [Myxococcaceae bacterium]|nr:hypothetical protein [Myxococcaceae bacterium]
MAVISLLLSFIGKKIGSIIQAIFGWSVTALFGRLPSKKQLAVSIALLVSIAWPVFVIGLFSPAVAGWALAFLPIEKWVGPLAMRIVWGALAFLAPLLVGGLTHWAAPSAKGGAAKALINGYPLAIGYFLAFIVTVVTVPLVKLASILRGWDDQHVYLQPRLGRYDRVLRELAEACARAGLVPEISEVPTSMALSTKALRLFASGVVSPIVAEQVKCIRTEGLELYLYPSDLLLRGKEENVALVRAMLTRTEVDADAYLVGSEAGQCIQDELGRLIEMIALHEKKHREVGGTAAARLVDIWHEMNESKLPFDEWIMLESIARRVERRLLREKVGPDSLPLDSEDDELDQIATQANAELATKNEPWGMPKKQASEAEENQMAIDVSPSERNPAMLEEASTADLVREAMDEAKELVRLEVALAKEEVKEELAQVQHAAISFGVAAGASVIVLCLLAVALVLALGGTALAALGVAGGFLAVAGVAGYLGYGMLPKHPLERTRHRLENDVNQLKEHIA